MKPLWIGLTCILISSILYGSTLIAAAIYSQVLGGTDGLGWSSEYGIFGTAMRDIGTVPLLLAVIVGVTGTMLIVMDLRGQFLKKKETDARNPGVKG
ncbi:phosphatase [Rossellomorea sp. YZS02]|uniref:phosphatase n=1 Tax=Rossellomorea sp. YZS02 TaxID=3097358 RepID=UPI002A0CB2D5|nr:phosphatase [Rossellomorea sp. YZS02]MDX8344598.1 phosphatase [Rossellomorea sp. YZS02]